MMETGILEDVVMLQGVSRMLQELVNKTQRAFTPVHLIIIIAMIGVLIAIFIPQFM